MTHSKALIVLSIGVALLNPWSVVAQGTGQELRMVVSPHTLQVAKTTEIVLTITGSNVGPGAPLRSGDVFELYLDLRGGSLRPAPSVQLQGPGLAGQNLTAAIDANGVVRLTYSGLETAWSVADSVQVTLQISSPVETGTSMMVLKSPADGRFGSEWKVLPVNVLPASSEALAGLVGPQGPAGPAGPAGATGAQGPAGPQGIQGRTGAEGPRGESGPQGSTGAAGPIGATGPAGAAGAAGPAGPIGPVGPAGPIGATGPAGAAGAAGPAGATGPAGPAGPAGATGPAGAAGAAGPAGPTGATGAVGPAGPAGPTGATGATGPAGPAGPAGATGATGATGPAGTSGLSAFATLFQLATISNATVVGGADVPFSNSGSNLGVTHTAGSTTATLPTAGAYEIEFSLSYTAGIGSAFGIGINGSVLAGSTVPTLTSTGTISGGAIVYLTAGDVITLRNNSSVAATLALGPSAGAQMLIKRLN